MYLGGRNANWGTGTICLFTLNSFNVDHILFTVALDNFSHLLTLEVTSDDL